MAKKTIGTNPLAAYLNHEKPEKMSATHQKELEGKKQRVTIHLDIELINRVKDAVYWEPGLTLTEFAQEALRVALEKLERKRGQKYPARNEHNLKGGRPLS